MKFGKFFEFGIHPEWRDHYLPYDKLLQLLLEASQRVQAARSEGGLAVWVSKVTGIGRKRGLSPVGGRNGQSAGQEPLLQAGETEETGPNLQTSDWPAGPPASSARPSASEVAEKEAADFNKVFFGACDRTNAFFRDRQRQLQRSLEELSNHCKGVEFSQSRSDAAPAFGSASGIVVGRSDPSSSSVADDGALAEPKFATWVSRPAPSGVGAPHAGGPRQRRATTVTGNHKNFWTHTQDKERVRKNWLTLYKMMGTLKTFAQLNYTAARKICKKFDKAVQAPAKMSSAFLGRSANMDFCGPSKLDALITRVEHEYARIFHAGDLRTALGELQAVDNAKVPHLDTLYLGFNVGIVLSLCLGVAVISQVSDMSHEGFEDLMDLVPVFRMAFCVSLMGWCWGLLVYTWNAYNINHAYMFDFNPQTSLTFVQVFKMASVLFAILGVGSFLAYAGLHTGKEQLFYVHARVYLLVVVLMFLAFLLNPFDCLHLSTRQTLYKTVFQVMTAPFWKVRFVGVYVGDVITSLVHPITDLEYTVCFFSSSTADTCDNVGVYVLPVVATLPYLWRMLQCLRRFRDTRDTLNLWNAGKYLTGVMNTLMGLLYADFVTSNQWDVGRVAWLVMFIVSVIYMYTWDVLFDWGFRPWSSRHFLLRDQLLYNRRWTYYFALVSNFFARFAWALTITPVYLFKTKAHHELIVFVLSAVEILRRFQWSFFRVENEYLSNNEKLRSIATVLPVGGRYTGGKLLHAQGSAALLDSPPASGARVAPSPANMPPQFWSPEVRRMSAAARGRGSSMSAEVPEPHAEYMAGPAIPEEEAQSGSASRLLPPAASGAHHHGHRHGHHHDSGAVSDEPNSEDTDEEIHSSPLPRSASPPIGPVPAVAAAPGAWAPVSRPSALLGPAAPDAGAAADGEEEDPPSPTYFYSSAMDGMSPPASFRVLSRSSSNDSVSASPSPHQSGLPLSRTHGGRR